LTLRVLDLFSGFGGASQAFVDAGDEVLRIENNILLKDVPHTHLMDVVDLHAFLAEYHVARRDYDLIWASPPCYEFSNAYAAPKPTAAREGRDFEPSTALVEAALDIIELLEPRWWVIENVRGACPHLNPILGKPRQVIDAFVMWGHFPQLILPEGFKHSKAKADKRHSPLRANHRAKVPLEISQAMRRAVVTQQKIV
jgi:site-specific DNA-cytosine methylase